MSYSVNISEDGRYIVCRVEGPTTINLAKDFSVAMHRLSLESHIKLFFIDARGSRNVAGMAANYDYAYRDMPDLKLQKDARAAILADPGDSSHDFVETVSRNAGYDVKIFHEREEAIEWLLGEGG